MRLGVDFGTTRTIVAAVDRGNYPVVSFLDPDGDSHEYLPSVAAYAGDRLVYGFDALAAARAGASLTRSFKRTLASPQVHPGSTVDVGGRAVPILDLLSGYLGYVRRMLLTQSSLDPRWWTTGAGAASAGAASAGAGARRAVTAGSANPIAVVAVPAHAHGPQRFLTLEAFRRAGFIVAAMLNEPSAAGFEYTHRHARTLTSQRRRVLVYDLGGGTFDASLVSVDGTDHEVIGSAGINQLGGDDFDVALAELVLAQAGLTVADLGGSRAYADLLDECRDAKERISPQSKRIVVEVADQTVTVRVGDFFERVRPLCEETVRVMRPLIKGDDGMPELTGVAGIYLVGGASGLPLVPRVLRAHFSRRVHSSPLPAASTAIGLAIAADDSAGYSLSDRLSRGFGVFREGQSGRSLQFDPLLTRDERVSTTSSLVVTRTYQAAHNVGWFRYVEHSAVGEFGEPAGDIVPFAEVVFPFDPALQDSGVDVREAEVVRREAGPLVEEEYVVDQHGIIRLRITDLTTGYSQTHELQANDA